MKTIEGDADFDSHDFVSNLKPRNNGNTNHPAAVDDDPILDIVSVMAKLESIMRDQTRSQSEAADDISGSDASA